MHPAHATVGADVFVAHGPLRREGPAVGARTGHILTHVLCTDPTRADEWDRWYDE